jgi:hypothetical protein
VSNGGRRTSATEAIFDTGATGTIIACRGVLSDIRDTQPMVFKGLSGDLEVTQKGMLKGIGRVYYDSRAIMSIISASECTRQGHEWEFQRDIVRGQDAFLLHPNYRNIPLQPPRQAVHRRPYSNGTKVWIQRHTSHRCHRPVTDDINLWVL